jgi:hypothetical protein
MNVLMTDMDHIVNWYSNKNDYACRLNNPKFPTIRVDHTHETQDDRADREDSHYTYVEVFGREKEHKEGHTHTEQDSLICIQNERLP